ncbi:hypothetical protein [Arthrobacter sp. N199823]|uniref:hypothetical protein n=1 Tax=Arthrobacter sp. N199823 TaxID=2058895 RepID=UPI000CE569D7|nr:hypothetical protein [Arthrobacter sp. N199823]
MAAEEAPVLDSRGKALSRRRIAWGISFLAIAVTIGLGSGWLWSWSEQSWSSGKVFFYVVSGWPLVFCGLFISGLAAVVGLLCLVPPMIRGIPHKGSRLFVGILVSLCTAAAAAVWLYFWLGSGLISIAATYYKVTAETGETVIVGKPGFDPASFAVYTQKSAFVYEEIRGIRGMAESGHFETDLCSLARQDSDLLLTCGNDVTRFPNPAK